MFVASDRTRGPSRVRAGRGGTAVRQTEFGPEGAFIRWTEAAGVEPTRVHVHGLGAASGAYTAHISAHPALAGRRTLYVDLPGFGISDRPADFGYSLEEHAD